MADRGIRKVTVVKNSLPDVLSSNQYLVRYRIVSEDRNRVSGWSPIFVLNAKTPSSIPENNVTYSVNNRIISLAWTDPEARPRYDIFIKFDGVSSYSYHKTVTSTNHTVVADPANTSFQFAIQVSGISKVKSSELEIYESSVISLV